MALKPLFSLGYYSAVALSLEQALEPSGGMVTNLGTTLSF